MAPAPRTTLLLAVAGGTLLLANLRLGNAMSSGAGSSTSPTTAVCQSELSVCMEDVTCNACMSGAEPTDYCSQRYPESYTSGSAGEGAGFDYCEATGRSYCCDFEDEATSDQCLTNQASVTYWACVMGDEGCEVSDMPCYTTGAVEPTTPAPVLTTPPASSSSMATSDYIITTSSTACQSQISACLEDDTCNACMSGSPPTDIICSQRYPSSFNTAGGEGAGYDYCDSTSAYYCCDYADEETADLCLTLPTSIAYWTCKMMEEGCEILDMPCYTTGAVETTTTPAPTSPTTPAPTGTVEEAGPIALSTRAPSAAEEDTEPTIVDVADNGGRKMTGSPQCFALSFAAGLLGASAGLVL